MSTDNKMRIATLTANYNNSKYIEECIDGILSQTRMPNTCVIVDDASTDNSIEVISNKLHSLTDVSFQPTVLGGPKVCLWKIKDTEFVVFSENTNRGPAGARNVGLRYLIDKSDLIFIADSDDIYYPNKIEESIKPFEKFKHVALVYSDYDNFNIEKNSLVREYKEPFSISRLYEECIVSNNSAIATSVIKAIGLYDESLRGPEDYDLWMRISDVGAAYHIPKSLYKYRITGNNITVTTPSTKFAEQVRIVHEKARKRHALKK